MYGRRYGSKVGRVMSSAPWFMVDDESCVTFQVIPGVTVDPQSGKYTPMSANEWAIIYQVAGVPFNGVTSIWSFQDTGESGLVVDLIAVPPVVTLTATGSGQSYQQPVSGWSRYACKTSDGTSCGWANTTVGLNSALTSTLLLAYVGFPSGSPAAARDIMSNALANNIQFNTSGKITANYTLPAALAVDDRNQVLPVITRVNNTALTSTCITSLEKVAGLYLLPSSGLQTTFGSGFANAGNLQYLYACELGGVAAELTDAQVKLILQTLGWTVAW